MCNVKNRVFILGSSRDLFFGDLDPLIVESPVLELTFVRHGVIDVDCDSEMVYLVEETGRVWHTKALQCALGMLENWKEVVVLSDFTCSHGQRNTTERVPITSVTCNNDGVLFTTANRELFGMGEFNDILATDVPQRIECFRGLRVMQVAAGNNFVVVLTQKKRQKQKPQPPVITSSNYTTSFMNGDDGDALSVDSAASGTFINAECQQCVPERDGNLLDPSSHQFLAALTTNHLQAMNNISKSTTETSMASSPCPSDDNLFEEDLPNISKSTPLKNHKDSALNFFLDLSQQQTKLITENVTKNITSMLSEGVKTLSRHMSGSDNTDNQLGCAIKEPESKVVEATSQEQGTSDGGIVRNSGEERKKSNALQVPFELTKMQIEKPGDESMEQSEASNSILDLGSANDLRSSEFSGGVENRIVKLCCLGSNLIDTDVWCFGSVNRGHLGTGDHIKRTCINSVLALSGQGVVKIECGELKAHLALEIYLKIIIFLFQERSTRPHLHWTGGCTFGAATAGTKSVRRLWTTLVPRERFD